MMAIQMPNLTSYSGSWLMWYSDRTEARSRAGAGRAARAYRKSIRSTLRRRRPERIEGKVRLACVIGKDGHVSTIELVHGLDDRLNQSAEEALSKWEFTPASRHGEPVEVDVLVEIPFRLGAPHAGFLLMNIDERQHLIFDADDTLWENNIYFEQAFDEFCAYLNHSTLTPDEIRGVLDEIEIVNNRIHGYGALNFGRNLSQCYLHLAERAVEEHDLKRVTAFAHEILWGSGTEEGVAETLPLLAERHELTLFTKGQPEEQNRKIDLSGCGLCLRIAQS